MMHDQIIGIAIAVGAALALVAGLLARWLTWRARVPRLEYRGVRYVYRGTPAWPDLERALDAAIAVAPAACAGLWLTITGGVVDTPTTPGGLMPDGRRVRGAAWAERLWPWSSPTWMVTIAKDGTMPTAAQSALWSEILARVEPLHRGVPLTGEGDHRAPLALELMKAAKHHYQEAKS